MAAARTTLQREPEPTPAEALQEGFVARAGAVALNLVLQDELRTIAGALAAEGVELIVLKGVPLAYRLFGRIDAREISDNDLLVRRRDAERAHQILRSLGYRSVDCRSIERQLHTDHQFRLAKPMPGAWLHAELHWHAFPPDLYPIGEELVWSHRESFDEDAVHVQVLDRPLTLLHLAYHFSQNHFSVPRVLRDVAAAWNRWFAKRDPAALLRLAHRTGLDHALDFALRSAADLGLLTSPPPPIASRRASRLRRWLPADRLFEPRPERDYLRWALALLLVDPPSAMRWLWNASFPSLETLAATSGRPPGYGLYLSYLARPLRPIMSLARSMGPRVRP